MWELGTRERDHAITGAPGAPRDCGAECCVLETLACTREIAIYPSFTYSDRLVRYGIRPTSEHLKLSAAVHEIIL